MFAEEFWGVGDFFWVLWGACVWIFGKDFQGFGEGCGADVGEAVVEFSGGFGFTDGKFFHRDDVACIELADDVHDGDAGFGVAVGDGGLDAGGSAVFREDGGVEVDDGFFGGFADGFSDDLSVGHDDDEFRNEVGEFIGDFSDFFRLPDGDAVG